MSLDDTPLMELKDRYVYLVQKYLQIAPELIKKIEEFGRIKKELEFITAEFIKRNAVDEIRKELEQIEKEHVEPDKI
jgi:hypothetical protein